MNEKGQSKRTDGQLEGEVKQSYKHLKSYSVNAS